MRYRLILIVAACATARSWGFCPSVSVVQCNASYNLCNPAYTIPGQGAACTCLLMPNETPPRYTCRGKITQTFDFLIADEFPQFLNPCEVTTKEWLCYSYNDCTVQGFPECDPNAQGGPPGTTCQATSRDCEAVGALLLSLDCEPHSCILT